jgi:hypothetical protein
VADASTLTAPVLFHALVDVGNQVHSLWSACTAADIQAGHPININLPATIAVGLAAGTAPENLTAADLPRLTDPALMNAMTQVDQSLAPAANALSVDPAYEWRIGTLAPGYAGQAGLPAMITGYTDSPATSTATVTFANQESLAINYGSGQVAGPLTGNGLSQALLALQAVNGQVQALNNLLATGAATPGQLAQLGVFGSGFLAETESASAIEQALSAQSAGTQAPAPAIGSINYLAPSADGLSVGLFWEGLAVAPTLPDTSGWNFSYSAQGAAGTPAPPAAEGDGVPVGIFFSGAFARYDATNPAQPIVSGWELIAQDSAGTMGPDSIIPVDGPGVSPTTYTLYPGETFYKVQNAWGPFWSIPVGDTLAAATIPPFNDAYNLSFMPAGSITASPGAIFYTQLPPDPTSLGASDFPQWLSLNAATPAAFLPGGTPVDLSYDPNGYVNTNVYVMLWDDQGDGYETGINVPDTSAEVELPLLPSGTPWSPTHAMVIVQGIDPVTHMAYETVAMNQ